MSALYGGPCNKVPPEAALYQLNEGDELPEVEDTEAVGTPVPHCTDPDAEGAEGNGFTLTATDVETTVQPNEVTVQVYVVAVVGETVSGLVVPTTLVPSDHEYAVGVVELRETLRSVGLPLQMVEYVAAAVAVTPKSGTSA